MFEKFDLFSYLLKGKFSILQIVCTLGIIGEIILLFNKLN